MKIKTNFIAHENRCLDGGGMKQVTVMKGRGFGAKVLLCFGMGLLLLLYIGCSPIREYHAALVLADIAARDNPSHWKSVTPPPVRAPYHYHVDNRRYKADLYLSGQDALAGLLLIPGAAEAGKDDVRLVAFVKSLARARFNILVPDLDSLRKLQVGPDNVRELIDTFSVLQNSRFSPDGRAGILAFSYAAGPAVLAALNPEIRDSVDFIFAVGGYHDLNRVLVFFTTGHFIDEGLSKHLPPNSYGKWVFVLSNLDRLSDLNDRERFKEMFERKKENLDAPVSDLASALTSEGRALYSFITNQDPIQVDALINKLPAGIRNDIIALDLANKNLQQLSSRLILVHGYDDSIIPYSESKALSRAVPKGQARLYLIDGLAHVDLKPGLIGQFRLWRAISALLAERER